MEWIDQLSPAARFALFSFLKILAVIMVVMPIIAYAVWVERKVSAFIQDRVGPNRVGPAGLLQPLADGLKSFLKEDFTPAYVRKAYYSLAPMITMTPALLLLAVIPFGSTLGSQKMVIADLNVGILYTFGIVSLGVYGIVLAGYASNSKYPFLGGIRSSAQMISYEIAMGLSVVPVFLLAAEPTLIARLTAISPSWGDFLAGTSGLNLSQVVAYQSQSFLDWLVFKQPLAFLIFLVSAFAETNRLPFDLPESETELVGGYNTEYSSMRFALFFMGEYGNVVASCAMIVTLFFGGWTLPFGSLDEPASTLISGAAHIAVFLAKLFCLMLLFIWIRWMLPRFRYDQLMDLGWRRFVPLALANILVTATVLWARS